jgi:hypothetical protein
VNGDWIHAASRLDLTIDIENDGAGHCTSPLRIGSIGTNAAITDGRHSMISAIVNSPHEKSTSRELPSRAFFAILSESIIMLSLIVEQRVARKRTVYKVR